MSINLEPSTFKTDGEYIAALVDTFLVAHPDAILEFATRTVKADDKFALDTAVSALVWTIELKKQQPWKDLRASAWSLAVQRLPLVKIEKLFYGLKS